MNMIRRFILAWQLTKYVPYVDAADQEGFWSKEDQVNLASYFQSDSGKRLKAILTNYVLKSAVNATAQTQNLPYECGIARGIALTVVTLQNHFAQAPAQESQPEEEGKAAPPFFEQSLAA